MSLFRIAWKTTIYLFLGYVGSSVLIILVIGFGGRSFGKLQAEYDLWRGRYELHGYGLSFGVPKEIERLKPYGIEYKHVAGCMVNAFIMDSVATYNLIMMKAIKDDLNIEIDWAVIFFDDAVENVEEFERDMQSSTLSKKTGPQILLHTQKPEKGEGSFYEIDECFDVLSVDVDGDTEQEDICLSYLTFKQYEDRLSYTSLIVNVIKANRHVLRQELNRSPYFEERFYSFVDINSNGPAELITQVRFSPDCAGCNAYRIYEFDNGKFNMKFHLFGVEPENQSIREFWDQLERYNATILKDLEESSYPCRLTSNCLDSPPWLIDSDQDGHLEIITLIETVKDDFNFNEQPNYLFYALPRSTPGTFQYRLEPVFDRYSVNPYSVGFIQTRDQSNHLLVINTIGGTSSAFPMLHVFDVRWPRIKRIGKFSGFYEHAIAERLRDLDEDGNTEIIYTGSTHVASNEAYVNIKLSFEIAEYEDGKYSENTKKFKQTDY